VRSQSERRERNDPFFFRFVFFLCFFFFFVFLVEAERDELAQYPAEEADRALAHLPSARLARPRKPDFAWRAHRRATRVTRSSARARGARPRSSALGAVGRGRSRRSFSFSTGAPSPSSPSWSSHLPARAPRPLGGPTAAALFGVRRGHEPVRGVTAPPAAACACSHRRRRRTATFLHRSRASASAVGEPPAPARAGARGRGRSREGGRRAWRPSTVRPVAVRETGYYERPARQPEPGAGARRVRGRRR